MQREDGSYDLSEKLSADDHGMLRARWDVTSLRRNAMNLGVPEASAIQAEFWSYEDYEAQLEAAKSAETPDEPEQPQSPEPVPGGSSTPVPADVSGRQAEGVAPATATGSGADEAPGDFTSPRAYADESLAAKPYGEWTKAQLTAEIEKRNEMRDGDPDYADEEPMVASGNKDELVARLTEDDEADSPE